MNLNFLGQNERFLDNEKINMLKSVFKMEPLFGVCKEIILRRLTEEGLMFMEGGKPKTMSASFNEVVNAHWIPFVSDCMDSIFTVGVVPVALSETEQGDIVPVVPPDGTYHISMVLENYRLRYKFWSDDYGKGAFGGRYYDPDVAIFSGMGSDPGFDGIIRSHVARLLKSQYFVAVLNDCAIMAEKISSMPTVLMQEADRAARTAQQGVDFDYYVDSNSVLQRAEDRYYKDRVSVDAVLRQQQVFVNGTMSQQSVTGTGLPPTTGLPVEMLNRAMLPSETKLVHQVMPNVRSDLAELRKQAQQEICAVLGVPRSMTIDDSVVKGNIEALNETMHTTVNWWKKHLSAILTEVNRRIYGKEDMLYNINKKTANATARREPLTAGELFCPDRAEYSVVTFNTQPYCSLDQLNFVYHRGLIDWEAYHHHSRRLLSLQQDTKNILEDPWSKTEKKAFILKALAYHSEDARHRMQKQSGKRRRAYEEEQSDEDTDTEGQMAMVDRENPKRPAKKKDPAEAEFDAEAEPPASRKNRKHRPGRDKRGKDREKQNNLSPGGRGNSADKEKDKEAGATKGGGNKDTQQHTK